MKRPFKPTPLRLRRTFGLFAIVIAVVTAACATNPPRTINNVCTLFDERYDWYLAAKRTQKRWGAPPNVTMAIMYQESRFRAKAKPNRKKYLGFIPGPRPSSAYGYAQALDGTWAEYKRDVGAPGADRDDFEDAIDFVGWYNQLSKRRNNIPAHDAYRLYLAYHEGHGGYARGSYKKKPWLVKVSKKVNRQSQRYQSQLKTCQSDLDKWTLRRWVSSVI